MDGFDITECDAAFKRDMDSLCGGLNWIERRICRAAAVDYYHEVLLFVGITTKTLPWSGANIVQRAVAIPTVPLAVRETRQGRRR